MPSSPHVRLVRRERPVQEPPVLDESQRRVVEHRAGPLLVLAGPGTGKTTTLVEAVVHRVEHDGLNPEHVLVLTFGRRAAAELRERIARRLGRTVREPLARTFHSYAFGLLRREAVLSGEQTPRLISGAEQELLRIAEQLNAPVATSRSPDRMSRRNEPQVPRRMIAFAPPRISSPDHRGSTGGALGTRKGRLTSAAWRAPGMMQGGKQRDGRAEG
jgi:hypothetical protein